MPRLHALALFLVIATAVAPVDAGDVRTDGKLVSEKATGPPLEVQSTDRVDNLNAELLDGLTATDFALADHFHPGSGYAHVVTVSPQGGDFTTIQGALDSIGDPGADRYLVWVGPGIYEETVSIQSGVDVQGAGQDLTIVRGSFHTADFTPDGGLVTVAGDSSLRDLTIENAVEGAADATVLGFAVVVLDGTGRLADLTVRSSMTCDLASSNFRAQAMEIAGGAPRLAGVTLEALTTGTEANGFCNAVALSAGGGATPEADDVLFLASAEAPVDSDSITIAVEVTGTSILTIRDSVLRTTGGMSSNKAFNLPGVDPEARVAHSQVDGTVGGSGTLVCVGDYDATFAALGAGCT